MSTQKNSAIRQSLYSNSVALASRRLRQPTSQISPRLNRGLPPSNQITPYPAVAVPFAVAVVGRRLLRRPE